MHDSFGLFHITILVQKRFDGNFKRQIYTNYKIRQNYISILVVILGTIISPYPFFWQATRGSRIQKKY